IAESVGLLSSRQVTETTRYHHLLHRNLLPIRSLKERDDSDGHLRPFCASGKFRVVCSEPRDVPKSLDSARLFNQRTLSAQPAGFVDVSKYVFPIAQVLLETRCRI